MFQGQGTFCTTILKTPGHGYIQINRQQLKILHNHNDKRLAFHIPQFASPQDFLGRGRLKARGCRRGAELVTIDETTTGLGR